MQYEQAVHLEVMWAAQISWKMQVHSHSPLQIASLATWNGELACRLPLPIKKKDNNTPPTWKKILNSDLASETI